jgi:hypothetical protein
LDLEMVEHLREVLNESLGHTALMLPVLFVVFLIIEAVSHKTALSKVRRAFSQPFVGPVVAAILGLIPQCGFSVAATTLFLEGMIPIGSLISAYISTSDEALPIMMADKTTLPWVLPLMATKLVWGAVVGICVNAAALIRNMRPGQAEAKSQPDQPPCGCKLSLGGCSHGSSSRGGHSGAVEIASHALSRALRIGAMVFVLSAVFNFIGHAAQGRIYTALSHPGLLQPVVAAVIGLIPSCATSVALAEGFRAGMLSFPAIVSGLSANSGLGLLILAKESQNKSEVIKVVILLVFAAIVAGLLGTMIFPPEYLLNN